MKGGSSLGNIEKMGLENSKRSKLAIASNVDKQRTYS